MGARGAGGRAQIGHPASKHGGGRLFRKAGLDSHDRAFLRMPQFRLAPLERKACRTHPPGYQSWDTVIHAALAKTAAAVKTDVGGRVEAFTWRLADYAGTSHPLDRALPEIGRVFLAPRTTLSRAISCGPWLWRFGKLRCRAGPRSGRDFPHAHGPERPSAVALLQFSARRVGGWARDPIPAGPKETAGDHL